jgi:hypothetical protein
MATLATTKRLDESTRDCMALGIWLVVLASALFLIGYGQSKLMTAGLMLQLTAAYSTFMLCGKRKYGQFVHGVPYAFAFAGAVFLCLAPDFHSPVEASLVFLAVTAMMHASIIYSMRKDSPETGRTACVSEYVT